MTKLTFQPYPPKPEGSVNCGVSYPYLPENVGAYFSVLTLSEGKFQLGFFGHNADGDYVELSPAGGFPNSGLKSDTFKGFENQELAEKYAEDWLAVNEHNLIMVDHDAEPALDDMHTPLS